jgi:Alginate export
MVASAWPNLRHRGNEVSTLSAAIRGRSGRLIGGAVLAAVLAAAAALSAATTVAADERGLELPGGRVVPPMVTDGPFGSTIGIELYDRVRGEFVDWFATPPNQSNSNFRYNLVGNKFQLGVRVKRDPYEFFVQFQDSTVGNVPEGAVGFGSTYFANTMKTLQNGTILRNAWASTRTLFGVPGLFIKGGRQLYSNAMEAPPKDPNLSWLQANRLSQRLIGPFDWTHTGRSQDGGQVGYDADAWNATVFGFRPTFGGYNVDANPELEVNLIGAVLSKKEFEWLGTTVGQLSYYYHNDYRDIVYVDNRPAAALAADKGRSARIHTVGANLVHVLPLGPGMMDGLAFGFGQFGDWQSLTQRAWAYGVEAGYQLTDVWAKPWLRGGINSGSGDTDPNDDTHETFFQMLPTAQLYAQFPFYNMMNNQDVLAQCILQPDPRLSFRLDFHWLRVNSSRDSVYSGGGATSNTFFGYTAIPANGRNELAYLTHFTLGVQATQNLLFNFFYAHAWGQGIIKANFVGNDANYGYVEMVFTY